MHRKSQLVLYSLVLAVLCGCVPKTDLDTLNEEYLIAQKQVAIDKKSIKQLEKQIVELKDENVRLVEKIDMLTKSVKEKDLVISVQGKVIKFLDDPNQTLQKNIQAQISDQK